MFPETADIERRSVSQDDEGGIEETWSAFLSDIPSQFAPLQGGGAGNTEARTGDGEFVHAQTQVILQGDHEVTEQDRCLTRGQVFDIIGVQRDSYALVTVLNLELRERDTEDSS